MGWLFTLLVRELNPTGMDGNSWDYHEHDVFFGPWDPPFPIENHLVGGFNHSENISQLGYIGMIIPNIWENKKMFQTTNQPGSVSPRNLLGFSHSDPGDRSRFRCSFFSPSGVQVQSDRRVQPSLEDSVARWNHKNRWDLGMFISLRRSGFEIPSISWLVVGPPLWKIGVRQLGWWDSQYFWENKIDVPNHQPDKRLWMENIRDVIATHQQLMR